MRAALERRLLGLWFDGPARPGDGLLRALLQPLAAITAAVSRKRRARVRRLPRPQRPAVIVVGNLLAGGTGKTPAVIALARALSARGWRVGLLARGYRAARDEPRLVDATSDASENGDEPVLLASATALPVAAGRRRAAALALLRREHAELDLVISDDGLQHVDLPRTMEVVVFDRRGVGNGRLLPAGPLREPIGHAHDMDAVLVNGDAPSPVSGPLVFRFAVEPVSVRALGPGQIDPDTGGSLVLSTADFVRRVAGRPIDALAGIGQPERFFEALRGLGLAIREHPLPDHARIDAATVAALDAPFVVMTSKDAVKCREFADDRCWALEVEARIDPAFVDWIEEWLRGSSTA
jgi:tetraacyldisaccharide 4'-kinase